MAIDGFPNINHRHPSSTVPWDSLKNLFAAPKAMRKSGFLRENKLLYHHFPLVDVIEIKKIYIYGSSIIYIYIYKDFKKTKKVILPHSAGNISKFHGILPGTPGNWCQGNGFAVKLDVAHGTSMGLQG